MITSQIPMLTWLAVIIGVCVGHNAVYSPTAALYSEMFPAHVRYSGALGYQLGGAIAGFVPLVAASLVGAAGGAYWPIPALIAAAGAIGIVCILLVRPAQRQTARWRRPNMARQCRPPDEVDTVRACSGVHE